MQAKSSNLALAADVTTMKELLHLADTLGPHLCVLKIHVDILSDFSLAGMQQLEQLAEKHGVLLFEDRKFADIGNTVKQQYAGGMYRIASWAHLVNAHILPGPGILDGLKSVGAPLGRGLLLLSEMSSQGSLAYGEYTQAAIRLAQEHADFVMGFICQQRLVEDPRFIHFTPGIHLVKTGDRLGQHYTSPEEAILTKGTDVIIVGRGILEAENPLEEAQKHQKIGWQAYLQRT